MTPDLSALITIDFVLLLFFSLRKLSPPHIYLFTFCWSVF